MSDERAGDQIVARIGFAETWLGRAKRQVAEGNLARGILTLVLADAEVHHAIEVAGIGPRRRAVRVPAIALPLALLVLAAATAIGLTRSPAPPVVLPDDAGAPVVMLATRAGSLLRLIPAPPHAVETPAGSAAGPRAVLPARPAVRSRGPTRVVPGQADLSSGGPVPAAPAGPPVSPVPPAPEPLVQAPPPPASTPAIMLTAGDLIDLVLAAERTLRGGPPALGP